MSNLNLDRTNLGDITGVLGDHGAVSDLSWMDLTSLENPEENYPSDSQREIIPQLEEQWSHDKAAMKTSSLIMNCGSVNTAANKADKKVSDEEVNSVIRVAKKAMMQGFSGSEVIPELRARFSSEVIAASMEDLKKVAAEEGLLGNVYLDMGAFDTVKEAATQLGLHKTRLASFVVGAPAKEANFVDAFGKCRHLAKTAVQEVEYNGQLLAHYASHLKNVGAIPQDATISSKEELRQAFLSARNARKVDHTSFTESKPISVSDTEYDKASAEVLEIAKANQEKAAAMHRAASARPVLARVQNLMLKGIQGEDLKNEIQSKCEKTAVDAFLPEIANLVNQQGLVGPAFVDISMYDNVPDAVGAVKGSFMRPLFLVSTMPCPMGFADRVASGTGIPVMKSEEDITPKQATQVVLALHASGKLKGETADALCQLAKGGEKPTLIIKKAMSQSAFEQKNKEAKTANTQQGYILASSGYTPSKPKADANKVKEVSISALEAGHPVSQVQKKVASFTSTVEAASIMREALAALDSVSAGSLDSCSTTKYPLKKTASIVKTAKCSACTFCVGSSCRKQGLSFKQTMTRTASSFTVSDPVREMQLGMVSAVDLDLSGVVTPPRMSSVEISIASDPFGGLSL